MPNWSFWIRLCHVSIALHKVLRQKQTTTAITKGKTVEISHLVFLTSNRSYTGSEERLPNRSQKGPANCWPNHP